MIDQHSDFSFVLCPGNRPTPSQRDLYSKIYHCWLEVWSEAFRELGVNKNLISDAFTRQDLIGAVFYKDQCIGMCFYRWTDSRGLDFAADSYFQIWNEEHRAQLCSRGPQIIVCSNLTLHPMARGQKLGVSGKDLVVGMAVQLFLHSKADAMTGAMRVDRGANQTTARWGTVSIAHRVPCEYGANNTELVAFFREEIKKSPCHELFEMTEDLWKHRSSLQRLDMESEFETNLVPLRKNKAA